MPIRPSSVVVRRRQLFLYFVMKLPKEGADGLPKDGFD